jgi:hypothetical protein
LNLFSSLLIFGAPKALRILRTAPDQITRKYCKMPRKIRVDTLKAGKHSIKLRITSQPTHPPIVSQATTTLFGAIGTKSKKMETRFLTPKLKDLQTGME